VHESPAGVVAGGGDRGRARLSRRPAAAGPRRRSKQFGRIVRSFVLILTRNNGSELKTVQGVEWGGNGRIRCNKQYRRAVGTHYWLTRIHPADYSPRYQRNGSLRAGIMILYHLRIYRRTQLLQLATTGRKGLLEHGHRRRIRRGRRIFQGLPAGPEQRTLPPIPPGPQYLPKTTRRTEQRTELAKEHCSKQTTRQSDLPGSGPTCQTCLRSEIERLDTAVVTLPSLYECTG
jgi:hypothetical protein